ncbi:unnamed protein product [Camellia sinensis]
MLINTSNSPPSPSTHTTLHSLSLSSLSQRTMAAKRGGVSLPERRDKKRSDDGVISRVSSTISESPIIYQSKRVASDAACVAKKLLKSTGKAAWIAGTTLLILVVPLIIEMDREQQLNDLDLQQASLLGTPPPMISAPQN